MLLYLTSAASKTLDKLIPFLPKPPQETKVAFIPTAADVYKQKPWQEEDKTKLIELGFQVVIIDIKSKNSQILEKELAGIDIIFMAGGNTIYLLEQIQKSNCLDLIKEKILSGTIYIGSSAGSIIAGPNIEFEKIFDDDDDYTANLDDYNALGLVNFVVLPHANKSEYTPYHQKIINQFSNKYQFKILKDNQAVLVSGDKTQLIEV